MSTAPSSGPDAERLMAALEALGFDTGRGIASTGGSRSFYLELVTDFQLDYLARTGDIRREADSAALARLAHDLKSVLRMLGEYRVAGLAEDWEVALRSGRPGTAQQNVVCDALDRFSRVLAGRPKTS